MNPLIFLLKMVSSSNSFSYEVDQITQNILMLREPFLALQLLNFLLKKKTKEVARKIKKIDQNKIMLLLIK